MQKLLTKLKSLFAKQDLTTGSPTKGILAFLVPILLSTIFQQLYTITDAAIVGQALPEASVAAINASSSIHYIVLNFGMGCASGFSILLSKWVGAKNVLEAKRSFLTQCILCVFVAIIIAVGGILAIEPMLNLLGIVRDSGDPFMQMEFEEATTYLTFLFASGLLVVFYNMSVANLRAKGDSFAPFCFLAMGVIINIFLDLLFIHVFQLGVAGSALATCLSEGIACLASLGYGAKKYEEFRFDFKNGLPKWKDFWEHIKNGIPPGLEFSVLGFGIIAMTGGVIAFDINPDGTTVAGLPAQIGYGAACKIINLLLTTLSSLGTALLSYTSQNYGAKDWQRIRKGLKSAVIIGLILVLILNVVGLPLLINGFYQYLFLSQDKISEASIFYGNVYLWMSIPSLLFILFLFLFRNALQGLEKPLWPLLGGVSELVLRIFVCAVLPRIIYGQLNSSSPVLAYYIVASGDWVAWIGAALTMLPPLLYYLKKYKKG